MIEKTTCENCQAEYNFDPDLGLNVQYVHVGDKAEPPRHHFVHNLPNDNSIFARLMRDAVHANEDWYRRRGPQSIIQIEGLFPLCPHCEHRGSRIFRNREGDVPYTLELKVEKKWMPTPEMQKLMDEVKLKSSVEKAVENIVTAIDRASGHDYSAVTIYDADGNVIGFGQVQGKGRVSELRFNKKDDDANST